jgi:hypothetical protein
MEIINYVQYSVSPNQKYQLIAIPKADANNTEGHLYIKSLTNTEVVSCIKVKDFDKHLFVVSDNGKFVFQIYEKSIGGKAPIDPWISYMKVYENGELVDTINLGIGFRLTEKDWIDWRNKKTISISSKNVAFKGDTLRIDSEDQNYYMNLNTGKLIGANKKPSSDYSNIKFRFLYRDVYQREKLKKKIGQ